MLDIILATVSSLFFVGCVMAATFLDFSSGGLGRRIGDVIVWVRGTPQTRSLIRFQKSAHKKLCYGETAYMENECLGVVFTDPRTGKVSIEGEPNIELKLLKCNSARCNKHNYMRYY